MAPKGDRMAAETTNASRLRKKELVDENARLERVVQDTAQRLALVEKERQGLAEENEHLRERGRVMERVRREFSSLNEKLELLTRLTKEINSLNPDLIFDICVTKIPFLLNARFASVYVYDEEQKKLYLKKHSHNRPIERVIDLERDQASLTALVLAESRVHVFADLDKAPPAPAEGAAAPPVPFRPFRDLYTTSSCIIAPLRAGDRVLGVLNLADRLDGRPFSNEEDLPLVQQVAELLAISLRNYQLFEKVQRQAKTDSLTKLSNHQTFFDELSREVTRADRYGGDVTIILVDIDRFKVINDNHGHLAGDSVLEEVAKILRENIRTVDSAARYGGDEFGLLLPESNVKAAMVVAERIRERVERTTFRFGGAELQVRVSQGLAQYGKGQGSSELIKAADEALYRAKRTGGGLVVG
jgi:diguanylate cyclase (GGDEF)-like protein